MVRKKSKYLKDLLTKDFFKKEYFEKNKSLLSISKEFNIPFTSLTRYFHKHNLIIKKARISKDFLLNEYFEKKQTQQQIANDLNCHVSIINHFFKKYNLKGRKPDDENHPCYKHGLYSTKTNPKNCVKHRKLINKNIKCKICNKIKKDMDIHHIDFNHLNNNKINLQILCHSCHSKLHRDYDWKYKRNKDNIKRDNTGRFIKNETIN